MQKAYWAMDIFNINFTGVEELDDVNSDKCMDIL